MLKLLQRQEVLLARFTESLTEFLILTAAASRGRNQRPCKETSSLIRSSSTILLGRMLRF